MSTTNEATSTAKDQAGAVAQTTKDEAGNVAGTAGQAAKDVAGTAKEQAASVASEATDRARDLISEARTQVSSQAGTQTQRLADGARSLASELHDMADRSEQQGPGATVVRQVADRTSTVAGYLEGSSPEQLLDDVRDFARRRPAGFLVGAGIAGFVAGRLLKGAKSEDKTQSGSTYDAGYQSYGQSGYGQSAPSYGDSYESYTEPYAAGDLDATRDLGQTMPMAAETYGAPTVEPVDEYAAYPTSTDPAVTEEITNVDPRRESEWGGQR